MAAKFTDSDLEMFEQCVRAAVKYGQREVIAAEVDRLFRLRLERLSPTDPLRRLFPGERPLSQMQQPPCTSLRTLLAQILGRCMFWRAKELPLEAQASVRESGKDLL